MSLNRYLEPANPQVLNINDLACQLIKTSGLAHFREHILKLMGLIIYLEEAEVYVVSGVAQIGMELQIKHRHHSE